MSVSIIIPTYNNYEGITKCIESIIQYTSLEDVELIIIANGCQPDHLEYLKNIESQYKELQDLDKYLLIVADKPVGFPMAINSGIKVSTGEYIILLNDDTILLPQEKDQWINMLVGPMIKHQSVGITGPVKKLFDNHKFILFFCAAINRSVINSCGYLDESLNLGGMEDVDMCIRADNKGYIIQQVPSDIAGYGTAFNTSVITGEFPIAHVGGATVRTIDNWDKNFKHNEQVIYERYHEEQTPVAVNKSILRMEDIKGYTGDIDHDKYMAPQTTTKPKKLNLGCGGLIFNQDDGWINCDLYYEGADVKCDAKDLSMFEDNSIDEIYNSHLIEHFDFHESEQALREWFRVLKPGGKIHIECPDLLAVCKAFVEGNEQDRIGLYPQFYAYPWEPGNQHKFLFTETQLRWSLEQVGFKDIQRVRATRFTNIEHLCLGMEARK